MPRRRICVVTGTRADYGHLAPVMAAIAQEPELELQVVATCMHLSPEFGLTYRAIEEDGFRIDARVEMLLSGDTPTSIVRSMGAALFGYADAFERLAPDCLMLLGDRFELLAAAQAALIMRIPIAHLAGGDTTEGAYDEAIRHSITKMSHLHFVTTEEAARRVRQLGENPAHVYLVGDPGIDHLRHMKLLDREALEARLGMRLRKRNLLVTHHPSTLGRRASSDELAELLAALTALDDDTAIIFTKPNADNEGRKLAKMMDDAVVQLGARAVAHTSLGQLGYFSALALVDVVVGNSSSGIGEAPSFGTPSVNIGDRQKGRVRAASVIDCEPERAAIGAAIARALELDTSDMVNPYGDGHAAERIVAVLREVREPHELVHKHFFDV